MRLARPRFSRPFSLIAAVLLLPLALTASVPAEAFPGESLFNKLATVLIKVGVSPDVIELTRYTLKEPSHSASVFGHAAAQDYPFFALIGAVKAAKGKNFAGIGVFDKAACNSPITTIDVVFGKADAYVDNAQGKQQTGVVVGAAKQYAADYAKAGTAQAKQEAKDQLAENIPYFGEIATICSFAFDTNFAIEAAAINQAKAVVNSVRKIHGALKDGDYSLAASEMFKLGADKQATCGFIDAAVAGGVVGRTPVLGSLARGACEGFTGVVIDGISGIVKGGVGVVESGVSYAWNAGKEGVCEVYSWFGSGCAKAPKLDVNSRNLIGAKQWCAPYGGFKAGIFNGAEVSFNCNDGSACRAKGGGPLRCKVEAEFQAWQAQQRQLIQAEFDARLMPWQKEFTARWQVLCPLGNKQCRNLVAGIQASTTNKILTEHKAAPNATYAMVTGLRYIAADAEAAKLIEDEKYRLLPGDWKAKWDADWSKKCPDAECRDMALALSDTIVQAVAGQKKSKPNQPYSAMSPMFAGAATAMGQEYLKALKRTGKAAPTTLKPLPAPTAPPVIKLRPVPAPKPSGN